MTTFERRELDRLNHLINTLKCRLSLESLSQQAKTLETLKEVERQQARLIESMMR